MRFTVLGSSGGYPRPGSACSGYLVEDEDTRIWIDAGSGTFARLLDHCSPSDLTGVLISHLHADHWTDLILGLHALRFAFERETPLPVYGPPGWTEAMGVVAEWAEEDDAAFVAHEVREDEEIKLGKLRVRPIRVDHTELETFGFRVVNGTASLAYSADSGFDEALVDLARGVDLFVCEAGAPGDEEMHMHMNGRQAGEIASRANVGRLLVTHLSPGADSAHAIELAGESYSGPVVLATDGLTVDI